MEDLISVIVPVYNVEKYLQRCIDSVTRQTYKNLEILLIDDGSTDLSGVLCDNYMQKDSRIRCFHKENGGLSDARNFGIERARGTYIAFVDSDDWIDESMIELLFTSLRKECADLAVCEATYAYEDGSKKGNFSGTVFSLNKEEALKMLIHDRRFRTNAWNKLYKASLWRDLKFPVGRKYEDVWVMHEIYNRCNKIAFIDQGLYYYFQRSDSIVHVPNISSNIDFIEGTIARHDYLIKRYPELHIETCAAVVSSIIVLYRQCGLTKLRMQDAINLRMQRLFSTYDIDGVFSNLSPRFKLEYIAYKISPSLLIKSEGIIDCMYKIFKH